MATKRKTTEEQSAIEEKLNAEKPARRRIVKKKAVEEEVEEVKANGSDELSTLRKKVRLYEDYLSYSQQYEAYNDYIARFYEVEQ